MRFVKVMLVLALVFAVSAIAYAETQSVKVSGDITLRSFARNNYDLDNDDAATPANLDHESTDWATYLTSTAEVQIDADLTDNVSGVIRLINQRVWGDQNYYSATGGELGATGTPFTDQVAARTIDPHADGESFKVDVDLAYIELKEFLYSPLTLTIGRQDLWFGKGFIVGAQLQDPQGVLFAPEYTAIQSFDAVRATLDYDPWTIDGIFSKIRENYRRADDDINLWGVNVGYVFEDYNAEGEAYWFFKQQRFNGTTGAAVKTSVRNGNNSNDVHTIGARGSFDPIEDWTIALEGAYQLGEYIGAANQVDERGRSAFAIDAMVECRYWQDDFAWRPVLGAEYIFYSGESNMGNVAATANGDYNGWDPIYRGKFDTAIREWQNVYYRTAMASCPSFTNQHQVLIRGTLEPTDSLTFNATYGHFWLVESWAENTTVVNENTAKNIGDEVDLQLTWDYTEDVQFGLLSAWFFPGDHFSSGQDDVTTDIVGTVSLSFYLRLLRGNKKTGSLSANRFFYWLSVWELYAFRTFPALMHFAQTFIFFLFPSMTALTGWRFGMKRRRTWPVILWPPPPLLLAMPLRLMDLPLTGFFPHI